MNWPTALLGFAAVAGVLTIIPGLDTALVLRTAIVQGRRHAFATALGINTDRGLLTNLLNPKIGAFYLAVLIYGAHSARGWIGRRATRRAMDATTGGVLIGFGVKLGLSAR